MASSADKEPVSTFEVEVVVEIPKGSFLKRGSDAQIDFVSPLPCPFNYGSIHEFIGGEGDYLDAVVMGKRLTLGSRITVFAYGAVGLSERYMYDDKLICSQNPISERERLAVVGFFHFYAFCKGGLNLLRGQKGRARCHGWGDAKMAMERASAAAPGRNSPQVRF